MRTRRREVGGVRIACSVHHTSLFLCVDYVFISCERWRFLFFSLWFSEV